MLCYEDSWPPNRPAFSYRPTADDGVSVVRLRCRSLVGLGRHLRRIDSDDLDGSDELPRSPGQAWRSAGTSDRMPELDGHCSSQWEALELVLPSTRSQPHLVSRLLQP